jgi:hypothetical protein
MKYYAAILLTSIVLLASGSPAHSQEIRIELDKIIGGIFSPPHRTAEINANAEIEKERLRQQAEVEKAKIAAETNKNIDRVAPVLTQWGVNRVNCTPGVAFINGLSSDTVCINPTGTIQAGYYNYSPDRQLLVRIDGNNAPTFTPASTTPKKIDRDRGF